MSGYAAYRDAFARWVEGALLQVDQEPVELPSVLEAISESQDIMPRGVCAQLDLPRGSTYADGAAAVMAREST